MGDILNNLPALPESLGSFGGTISFNQILSHLGAYVNGLIEKLVAMVPAQVMDIYNTHTVVCLLAIICLLGLVAFEGYRFYRMLTYAGSAFLFGIVGYWQIAPALEGTLKPMVPEFLDYYVLVAVACALVAILLCVCAFNFVILILGGAVGYVLGSGYLYGLLVSYFASLDFLKAENVKHIVGGIIAVICALVFALMFKMLFMLTTSFGGSIGAALILQSILVPAGDNTVKIGFAIVGVVVAIFALIRQRKQEDNIIFRL